MPCSRRTTCASRPPPTRTSPRRRIASGSRRAARTDVTRSTGIRPWPSCGASRNRTPTAVDTSPSPDQPPAPGADQVAEGMRRAKPMTEEQWLACADPEEMQDFIRDRMRDWIRDTATERKLRLFACACARRFWQRLDGPGRMAVEVSERYADGVATEEELRRAREDATRAAEETSRAVNRVAAGAAWTPGVWAAWKAGWEAVKQGEGGTERGAQCALLRDLFGPLPFRAVTIDPSLLKWNNGAVVELAQAI